MEKQNNSGSNLLEDFRKSLESFESYESEELNEIPEIKCNSQKESDKNVDDLLLIKKKDKQKREIFKKEMKKAFLSSDKVYQINFLKIYRIYKLDIDIFEEWIKYYKKINDLKFQKSLKKQQKSTIKKDSQKKENLFNFPSCELV